MVAASLKKVIAIVALAVLVFSLVVVPGNNGVVVADSMGGGFPVEPPPDTSGFKSSPDSDESDWTEVSIFFSTVTSMIL